MSKAPGLHPLASIPLACPIDGQPLLPQTRDFRCENGHTYDRARQGYVNLLPVQFKSSRKPGDSREMVAARSAALNSGVFEVLADYLATKVKGLFDPDAKYSSDSDWPLLIDAGCGDGYYSDYLLRRAETDGGPQYRLLGADISRPAIVAACRRNTQIGWVVANNTHLPVLTGQADVVLSIFGFEAWEPWAALQKSGQFVITVDAGPDHLLELRELLYDRVQRHGEPQGPGIDAGYRLLERKSLGWRHGVSDAQLRSNLVAMTPHRHRATNEALTAIQTSPLTDVTLEVVVRTYRRI